MAERVTAGLLRVVLLPLWLASEIGCRVGTALAVGVDRMVTLAARIGRRRQAQRH